ncbi:methionyl-tRNA formyltransferase, partial [Listeria monocytogenes]|nr:methionyl-tRNA formyltransferase [Listeria monocytogenes]
FNQIRGLSPWPVAYTTLEEKPFKIWEATYEDTKEGGEPGAILADKTILKIVAGDGTLIVPTVIQPAGKPKMDVHSFMSGAGRNLSKTTRFGE